MKRKFIFRLIAGGVVSTTLFTGMPLRAKGEWRQDSQGNYYFNEGNGFSSGWRNIDGSVYYFDSNGVMQKGWINYEDQWYFFDNYGVLKTGWINYNNNWYYTDSAGRMQTGIINVNGKTYCLAENGVMQTKNLIIDGQFYTIGNNGEVAGSLAPNPDKVFDYNGNCIQSLGKDNENIKSPIEQLHMNKISDESEIGDYDAPTRKFKITFRDYNGEEIESKTVKEGSSINVIDADSREGYEFVEWNTKSDGNGKAYDEGDKVKVTSDINLYAIYKYIEETTLVNSIEIKGDKEVEIGKEKQLTAVVKPGNADNTEVKWSVVNGTGEATIDSNGMITGVKEGSVTVKAEAADSSGKSQEYPVSVVPAKVSISKLTISAENNENTISTNGGTLQMKANISPENASNDQLSWNIVDRNGNKVTGIASVDSNGLVTAISNTESDDPIYVVAKATDGSGAISNQYEIKITNQTAKVNSIIINSSSRYLVIKDGGELQLTATDNNDKEVQVKWTVDDSSKAEISSTGLLKGISQGNVTVRATYDNGDGNIETAKMTFKVIQPVTQVDIAAENESALAINTQGGSLKLIAKLFGENGTVATNHEVRWAIDTDNSTGEATINELTGKITAIRNGEVKVIATPRDIYKIGESEITGSVIINISNQEVPVNRITLYREDDGNKTEFTDSNNLEVYLGGTTTKAQVVLSAKTFAKRNEDTPDIQKVEWSFEDGSTQIKSAKIEKIDDADDPNKIRLNVSKPGKITIKAKVTNTSGSQVVESRTITVKKYISGITFNPEVKQVTAGNPVGAYTVEAIVDGVDLSDESNITNDLYEWSIVGSEENASINDNINIKPTAKNGQLIISKSINIKKQGTVKVRVKALDGSGKSAEQTLNIMPYPHKVVINSDKLMIDVDENLVLSALVEKQETDNPHIQPIQGVIWSIPTDRSEERRVGKECRSRWSPYH